jgi:hypothetical protein
MKKLKIIGKLIVLIAWLPLLLLAEERYPKVKKK